MWGKRLAWRVYGAMLVVSAVAVCVSAWYTLHTLGQSNRRQIEEELLFVAQVVADRLVSTDPAGKEQRQIEQLCREVAALTHKRVTVVLPSGQVVADSHQDAAGMESHADRPEIIAALREGLGQSVRFSDTLRRNLMYVAVPVKRGGETVAVVRSAVPLAALGERLRRSYGQVMGAGVVAIVVSAFGAFYLSRRITSPLERMREVAQRLAAGDLEARVPPQSDRELAALAETLNRMAADLAERMRTVVRQRNELQAILASMVEGVLAVDTGERIIEFNRAALDLLEIQTEELRGRKVVEVVRQAELRDFIHRTMDTGEYSEGEMVFYGRDERCLEVHGRPLKDGDGTRMGALVVVHDITRLKRMEKIRQDFVANVSHELKTPLTAIRGCVETLEGTVTVGEEGRRFVEMLARHVARMERIVGDLLTLSRVEYDAERGRISLSPAPVGAVVRRAVGMFAVAAREKNIELTVQAPDDLEAPVNEPLLEQAVGNLIDNAIRYSPSGSKVVVSVATKGEMVEIAVRDNGPGIEKQHLPRIFERFYRVDVARSRATGGTGLGLAIVKHIALAHHGEVSVESTPGQGSTFSLRIPVRPV